MARDGRDGGVAMMADGCSGGRRWRRTALAMVDDDIGI